MFQRESTLVVTDKRLHDKLSFSMDLDNFKLVSRYASLFPLNYD